jgi:hypothetical protein
VNDGRFLDNPDNPDKAGHCPDTSARNRSDTPDRTGHTPLGVSGCPGLTGGLSVWVNFLENRTFVRVTMR